MRYIPKQVQGFFDTLKKDTPELDDARLWKIAWSAYQKTGDDQKVKDIIDAAFTTGIKLDSKTKKEIDEVMEYLVSSNIVKKSGNKYSIVDSNVNMKDLYHIVYDAYQKRKLKIDFKKFSFLNEMKNIGPYIILDEAKKYKYVVEVFDVEKPKRIYYAHRQSNQTLLLRKQEFSIFEAKKKRLEEEKGRGHQYIFSSFDPKSDNYVFEIF